MTTPFIKLSALEGGGFWEIPIVYEDDSLLAVAKPSGLLSCPDRYDPNRPNLMKLLHHDIERGTAWASERKLSYLMNVHRLDFETSGVMLLVKNKEMLVAMSDLFGTDKPFKEYVALVHGVPEVQTFSVEAKLGPHPVKVGLVRVDPKNGKKSKTDFEVVEKYYEYSLLRCRPLTGRTHQIRAHLKYRDLPIVGDELYGGKPLFLSRLKRRYKHAGPDPERPLIGRVALHAEKLVVTRPDTNQTVTMMAEWPKDFAVAVKYLQKFGRSRVA